MSSFVPNLFTLIRILLIPVFILFFLQDNFYISGFIFVLSAITDFMDGYLARKYDLTTHLGKLLDPLADKLTIISILFVLIYKNILPELLAVILLSREIFILFGSGLAYMLGIDVINPSPIGKLSIVILYSALAAYLLNISPMDMILFYIAVPLNIISGIDYILKAFRKSGIFSQIL